MKKSDIMYIGADHAGFELKESMKRFLKKKHMKVLDLSERFKARDDYPDIAGKVARAVVHHKTRGILFCGTGMGVCIAANKIKGARAALVYNSLSAKLSKEHNNANIICMGGRIITPKAAEKYFTIWHNAVFSDEVRHHRRVRKLNHLK